MIDGPSEKTPATLRLPSPRTAPTILKGQQCWERVRVQLLLRDVIGLILPLPERVMAIAKRAPRLLGIYGAILIFTVSASAQVNNSTRIGSELAFTPDIDAARANPSLTHGVQMKRDNAAPLIYFLDKAPNDIRASTLPAAGKDVLLARVRLLGVPAYRGGRGPRGGRSQDPLPKELLSARLKILEVLSGHASVGSVFDVTFGQVDQTHSLIPVPRTQSELEGEYFVVLYSGDGDQWHLAGFPISEEQYQKWQEKFWADERERMGIAPKR
jgi:hypothetical protein